MRQHIFEIQHAEHFKEQALAVFRLQANANPVYRAFIEHLGINPTAVNELQQIPFLPVEFFKNHRVQTATDAVQEIFTSSGTTGQITSSHYVADVNLYIQSFSQSFNLFYGPIEDYVVLALLPAYLERPGSSLVYMAKELIAQSKQSESGFYLYNHQELYQTLQQLEAAGRKVLLLGVTFALLDFAEAFSLSLKHTIVMETGGMKGRRKEMLREEIHGILQQAFDVSAIHSEYGMTELLSQAYSKGNGLFATPSWMKILIRDVNDPMQLQAQGISGGINIIDLANIDSCAFIATKDIGKIHPNGQFEVLGRFDYSDIRGCNLMVG